VKQRLVFAAATALLLATTARAENVIIEHVTLIDGIHSPQRDMTVTVQGERIGTLSPSALAHGLKGRRIDGRGRFLIPGLMDVHIHLKGRDPTLDIDNTKSIVFVMKNGQIIDESRLPLAGGRQKRRFDGE